MNIDIKKKIKNHDYALIGYPLGHSVSPYVHEELFRLAGNESRYSLYEMPPENLADSYDYLKNLKGFNITIPLKTDIIQFCKELDITAERCGAVNCVDVIHGRIGYNTDVYGFIKSVEILGASLNANTRICVVGYGGAGRMFVAEALRQGAEVTVAVRDKNKIDLSDNVRVININEINGNYKYDLIINASPSGMYPNVGQCPVDFNKINAEYVLDAIFNPLKTRFILEAEERGIKALNGVPMLVWQAVRSHEIWNGSEYKDSDISELICNTQKMIDDKNTKRN